MMARGEPVPKKSLESGPHSIPYTAKGERLLRERLERENAELPEELENFDNMSPEEKKEVEAERRAAWRKARLKSLENDAIQAQLVIQKMSELVVTSDSPIDDLEEESSEGQQ